MMEEKEEEAIKLAQDTSNGVVKALDGDTLHIFN